jgi:hypothetical protein
VHRPFIIARLNTLQKAARIKPAPLSVAKITIRFCTYTELLISIRHQIRCGLTSRVEVSRIRLPEMRHTCLAYVQRPGAGPRTQQQSSRVEAHKWVQPINKKIMEFGT